MTTNTKSSFPELRQAVKTALVKAGKYGSLSFVPSLKLGAESAEKLRGAKLTKLELAAVKEAYDALYDAFNIDGGQWRNHKLRQGYAAKGLDRLSKTAERDTQDKPSWLRNMHAKLVDITARLADAEKAGDKLESERLAKQRTNLRNDILAQCAAWEKSDKAELSDLIANTRKSLGVDLKALVKETNAAKAKSDKAAKELARQRKRVAKSKAKSNGEPVTEKFETVKPIMEVVPAK